MAIPKIKATYTLDVETVRTLEATARKWQISKSETLRRMIRAGALDRQPAKGLDALAALDELQAVVGMERSAAVRWQQEARRERRSGSARRERGRR